MNPLRRLIRRYQSAKLAADVKAGRKHWGRQTVSAVIIRADGTVEDLGTISEGVVEFRAEGK